MLLIIPLTVYLAQQQQETQSHANPNTTLTFNPTSTTAPVNGQAEFDVLLTPGTNQVNFVKLVVKFDPTKLKADENSFQVNPGSGLSIRVPTVVNTNSLTVTLDVGVDRTKYISKATTIGTLTFDVIAPSDTPTQVDFDTDPNTGVLINSVGTNDFSENVFLKGAPATVTIQGDSISPSPSVEVSETPVPSISVEPDVSEAPSPSEANPSLSPDANAAPVCSALTADPTVGTAPTDVTFNVTGSDSDGTVSKITFNYGDGQIEDVTTGDTIGTDTLNFTQLHTYSTSGSFTATALLTDDGNGTSDTTNCSQNITISSGGEATDSATITPLAATGPSNAVVGLGFLGGLLFMIGALLFLAL